VADPRLDLGELRQLSAELASIITDFDGVEALSDSVGASTGHDRLGDRISEFARNWSKHRAQLVKDVQTLHQYLDDLTNGFTEIDEKFAKALEADDQTAAS
jgi:hypothetical protein